MAKTLNLKAYLLNSARTPSDLVADLIERDYYQVLIRNDTQTQQNLEILAYANHLSWPPPWFGFISDYLVNKDDFGKFSKYDLVLIITLAKTSPSPGPTFVFTAGASHHHISRFIDHRFGIAILERVFDPETNKIESLAEKGIVGDILASTRFYRRARSLAFEDDFGKYFQKINVALKQAQVRQYFPDVANRKKSLRPQITISGASLIEVQTKGDFFTYLQFVKNLGDLLRLPENPIFNQSLVPLTTRQNQAEIDSLKDALFKQIETGGARAGSALDVDFCHRNFEAFYASATLTLTMPALRDPEGNPSTLEYSDLHAVQHLDFMDDLVGAISSRAPSGGPSLSEIMESTHVETVDQDGTITTSGPFLDYLQAEIATTDGSYFLLDSLWYKLRENFDKALTQRFVERLADSFRKLPFAKTWTSGNETAYNQLYDQKHRSLYLHMILVDAVELADVLHYDASKHLLNIIHVKSGLDGSMRDLCSQIFLAARILEGEIRSGDSKSIKALYKAGVHHSRIDPALLSEGGFVEYFTKSKRTYSLFIRARKTLSVQDATQGNFDSRIAKFSLVELAAAMRANQWNLSITLV